MITFGSALGGDTGSLSGDGSRSAICGLGMTGIPDGRGSEVSCRTSHRSGFSSSGISSFGDTVPLGDTSLLDVGMGASLGGITSSGGCAGLCDTF